ncbi:ATP-binding SpoIIE family protein phosphatase [Actinacidiphila acididurans]|uniref:SpoIIE family protein phosphatase n=1 Tax=Actinacidiphila acididurans TaxID=2784346 RepID=A0ABS2TJG7_9ACTN|nr:SpoIIE family protein phosphatase [Actinacidiphila acididurans]MBM9503485.1 SpoIIE family protein phosphatase [Actinacidiphila acididurans]
MSALAGTSADRGFCLPAVAAAVVGPTGTVLRWSAEAAALLGRPGAEVCGRPFADLLADGGAQSRPGGAYRGPPRGGRVALCGADGEVDAWLRVTALAGAEGEHLVLIAPYERAVEWGEGTSLLRAVRGQQRIGIALHRTDLRLEQTNITPEMFGGPPVAPGVALADVLRPPDAAAVEAVLADVLHSGVPVLGSNHLIRSDGDSPPYEWTMSLSAFRLEDAAGRPSGVAAVMYDVSEQERVRRHRELLHRAAERIGFSLDVRHIARALADVVAEVGSLVTVDLAAPVLDGNEPSPAFGGNPPLVRVAVAGADGTWPPDLLNVGERYPDLPESPEIKLIGEGRSITLAREDVARALGHDPGLCRTLLPPQAQWAVVSPLFARGTMFGSLTTWRDEPSAPFDEHDVELLAEISSRAALGIDNARRYTHEHKAAVALQQSLLPRAVTNTSAVRTAGVYRPARGGAGVGGDWFDVIPLPSLRVAFVVGDVFGHGLSAAATMGRLRTAVQTFAALELEPAEVLGHMADLVQRIAAERPFQDRDMVGATCMYAVYDPATCQCVVANAGQPPPVLVRPDGAAETLSVPPGPPLGVAGEPFTSVTFDVPEASVLALFTDGLLDLDAYAGPDGPLRLGEAIAARRRQEGGGGLADTGGELLSEQQGGRPRDDVALLLARTAAIDPANMASWEFPADAESVAAGRSAAVRQLDKWGLDDLAFNTELVVSELITNAMRYAGGPVQLRLIRDKMLICEVADPSNTQPRLTRAASTDEGGRGLFIVAQCTARWGCRYGQRGKTIWTELPITAEAS